MKRSIRRWLGLSTLAAALLAAHVPATNAQEIDEDAAFERFVLHCIPGMTREERDRRARTNGALRISGRVHARGNLFATSVHVEPGAEVDASEGLVLYSLGPIVVDGKIQGGPRSRAKKEGVGANGADGAPITMISEDDVTIGEDLAGNPGAPGANVVLTGPSGRGGRGGRGGQITIRAKAKGGTITVNAVIAPGRGGDGGYATITGADGATGKPGQKAMAVGGDSGDDGKLTIQATNVVFGLGGKIRFPEAKTAGQAIAAGGNGGDAPNCYASKSGAGGDARALGGRAGKGTDVLVSAGSLLPAGVGAAAFVLAPQSTSAAGAAQASGGRGGGFPSCDATEGCPARGRPGSASGDGGDAFAKAGDGQFPSRIFGPAFGGRTPASVEDFPSIGGAALAIGGGVQTARDGEAGRTPGVGGRGGKGGASVAIGGVGGACRVGVAFNGGPLAGGDGGDAVMGQETIAVAGGGGGKGGDCCDSSNGKGAEGGKGGGFGPQTATPGKGGKSPSGFAGAAGKSTIRPANVGLDGVKGGDCAGLSYSLSVVPNPTTHDQSTTFGVEIRNTTADPVQVTVQLFHLRAGQPPYLIRETTVTVPGSVGPVTGTITVYGYGSPPTAGNNQTFQVKVGGKEVGRKPFDVK